MPATADRLRTYLSLAPARPVDDLALDAAVEAANSWIAAVRTDLPPLHDETGDPIEVDKIRWPAHVDYACMIQAARLYGRRGSVQGVAAFADAGVSLLARLDPDVRSLLELGEFQPSATA